MSATKKNTISWRTLKQKKNLFGTGGFVGEPPPPPTPSQEEVGGRPTTPPPPQLLVFLTSALQATIWLG